jgi:hypothetical protein
MHRPPSSLILVLKFPQFVWVAKIVHELTSSCASTLSEPTHPPTPPPHQWIFLLAKNRQKVIQFSEKQNVLSQICFLWNRLKRTEILFFSWRVWLHLWLLATVLRVPWNNVVGWVKVGRGMLTMLHNEIEKNNHCEFPPPREKKVQQEWL